MNWLKFSLTSDSFHSLNQITMWLLIITQDWSLQSLDSCNWVLRQVIPLKSKETSVNHTSSSSCLLSFPLFYEKQPKGRKMWCWGEWEECNRVFLCIFEICVVLKYDLECNMVWMCCDEKKFIFFQFDRCRNSSFQEISWNQEILLKMP